MYRCPACGETFGEDGPWRCPCGHALEYATRPRPEGDPPADPEGMDFSAFLPIDDPVSLGEGWTPLVSVPAFDASVKLEYCSPTASFKDRGAATVITQALAVGVDRVVEDSSGNAGISVASYAARAGLDAEIFVPAGANSAKLETIERTGADLRRVHGDRTAVTKACVEAVEAGAGWYASHAWHPAFLEGTATTAYEIAAQRGWSAPDVVVTPVGHGTLLLGLERGFRSLRDSGWIEQLPRLVGVQARGVAPLCEAETGPVNELAAGIQIPDPARRSQIEAAFDRTDGAVLAVGEQKTVRARDHLARIGFHVAPTSATALAGLKIARERGILGQSDTVVVPLTGSGLVAQ